MDCFAFAYSRLLMIRIPSNVEMFGKYCFSECKSLCEVVFESNSKLREIDDLALSSSGIKTIRIPSNVEMFGKHCFSGCKSLYEVVFE
jgi:hypothetical protein